MIFIYNKKIDSEFTGNGIGAIIGSTIPGISDTLAGVIGGKVVEKFINRYKADNDSKIITLNCGYFWSKEISKQNTHLDINKFFSINDCLADEFFCTCDINSNLDKLSTHLLKLKEIYKNFSITIDIEGFVNSDSSWLKTICEELILILHLDENFPKKVIPSCMQSERYLYKSLSTNNQVNILRILFDKINYFSNYKKV